MKILLKVQINIIKLNSLDKQLKSRKINDDQIYKNVTKSLEFEMDFMKSEVRQMLGNLNCILKSYETSMLNMMFELELNTTKDNLMNTLPKVQKEINQKLQEEITNKVIPFI